ncbi:MAG: IS1634 family transposase [Candidatus Sericytochromatia bacterium]|uniref:IS1634 family transposase n=1 Tax=Candidatus Tanganyikabacteria bacterium TaxID=2961651 RepID=A0A937X588_9BACT|nr:IS1634 family transposase [Candidatus Tanganyikabacteria bacterium]
MILAPVWERLGIRKALRKIQAQHAIKFPLERLVFGMVLNRIVDPMSKMACNEWLRDTAFFPEWEKKWDVSHFYRALDLLEMHWSEIEQALYEELWKRTSPELRAAWLTDTSSMYFEARMDDVERAEIAAEWAAFDAGIGKEPLHPRPQVVNDPPMRMQGHNKDGHPGDPQVVVASVCLANGLVLRHRVYPGNTNDQTIAKDLITTLPAPPDVAQIWVSDGGMASGPRLRELDEMGWYRLTADPPRSNEFVMAEIISRSGRYIQHPTKPQFSFRIVDIPAAQSPSGKDERFLVVRNSRDRDRQLKQVEKHLGRIKEALAKREPDGTHSKAVCKLVSHPSLKRYVEPSERVAGRYVLSNDAVRREQLLAGTRVYRTTVHDRDPVEMFDSYQLLQAVEANHKEMKGPLRLRPRYHRAGHRIRAHVMIVILAVNCVRVLEAETGRLISDLRRLFTALKATEVGQGGKRQWMRTELTDDHRNVLAKLDLSVPPQTWAMWSDATSKGAMVC